MKERIKTIRFHGLRNEEHFEFHSEITALVSQHALAGPFQSLLAIYQGYYQELNKTLEVVRKSAFTRQLTRTDQLRTATYRRLRLAVQGFLQHVSPDVCAAAHRIITIIHHYGNLARASRDQKTAALDNLLDVLRKEAAADLQSLGLSNWIDELGSHNQTLRSLKESRSQEREARHAQKNVRKSREETDDAYRMMVRLLEVHGALNPADEDFTGLIFQLNDAIGSYCNLIAQRYGIMAAQKENLVEKAKPESNNHEAV